MFLFFWTYMLDFADVSSPSLMGYGQSIYGPFTDLQRFSFIFRFSFGDSDGFSGPGLSHLNSDATVACEGRPQGAPLPIQAASRSFVPLRCICPGLGQVRSSQVDLSRSRSIQVDVILFFLDLCAFLRKRFFAVFDGLWAVEIWAIHRLTAALIRVQFSFWRE